MDSSQAQGLHSASRHSHHHHHHRSSRSRHRRKEARQMAWRIGSGLFFLCVLLLFMFCGIRNIYILSPVFVGVIALVALLGVLAGVSTYFLIRRKQREADA